MVTGRRFFSPAGKSDDVPCISSVGKSADLPASSTTALEKLLLISFRLVQSCYDVVWM